MNTGWGEREQRSEGGGAFRTKRDEVTGGRRDLVRKTYEKSSLGRIRLRWKNNIPLYLKGMIWKVVDYICPG
jgi:hypothetical protein